MRSIIRTGNAGSDIPGLSQGVVAKTVWSPNAEVHTLQQLGGGGGLCIHGRSCQQYQKLTVRKRTRRGNEHKRQEAKKAPRSKGRLTVINIHSFAIGWGTPKFIMRSVHEGSAIIKNKFWARPAGPHTGTVWPEPAPGRSCSQLLAPSWPRNCARHGARGRVFALKGRERKGKGTGKGKVQQGERKERPGGGRSMAACAPWPC